MSFFRFLQANGIKLAPRDVALKVVDEVACSLIEKLEGAGPGFVNIWLKQDIVQAELNTLLDKVFSCAS